MQGRPISDHGRSWLGGLTPESGASMVVSIVDPLVLPHFLDQLWCEFSG